MKTKLIILFLVIINCASAQIMIDGSLMTIREHLKERGLDPTEGITEEGVFYIYGKGEHAIRSYFFDEKNKCTEQWICEYALKKKDLEDFLLNDNSFYLDRGYYYSVKYDIKAIIDTVGRAWVIKYTRK